MMIFQTRGNGAYLAAAASLLLLILSLAWLERSFPHIALLIFVVLSLTTGFAHGATDIWLLWNESRKMMLWKSLVYAATVVILLAVLLPFPAMALSLLLLMSVWHFGEQPVASPSSRSKTVLRRVVLGGASVMWPVLISFDELRGLIAPMLGSEAAWLLQAWQAAAWIWLMLMLVLASIDLAMRPASGRGLWLEVAVIALLNAALSPLLAFALFFGIHHSGMHLWRMMRMHADQISKQHLALWMGTLALTWLGLAALWSCMPAQISLVASSPWLAWLITSLAAVTLPHLVVVSGAYSQLYRQS
jgi:beta-carotene 15,15'-dioxygenase